MTEANYKRFRCSHCTVEFEALKERRYCCKKCNKAAIKKNKTSVSRAEYLANVRENAASKFNCEHCGKEAHRKLSGTNKKKGVVNRFCSMSCRVAWCAAVRDGKQPDKAEKAHRNCSQCGALFLSSRNKLVCSKECAKDKARSAAKAAAEVIHRAAAKVVACDECGAEFCPLYGASHSTLCQCCVRIRQKRSGSIGKARRKALIRGCSIAESVDPIKVFERDKWRCQLCGIKTPRSLRGTYRENAPEMDHIIPLAKGGAHTYANTQCACRKCNGAKSDTPKGQLLLIG